MAQGQGGVLIWILALLLGWTSLRAESLPTTPNDQSVRRVVIAASLEPFNVGGVSQAKFDFVELSTRKHIPIGICAIKEKEQASCVNAGYVGLGQHEGAITFDSSIDIGAQLAIRLSSLQ